MTPLSASTASAVPGPTIASVAAATSSISNAIIRFISTSLATVPALRAARTVIYGDGLHTSRPR